MTLCCAVHTGDLKHQRDVFALRDHAVLLMWTRLLWYTMPFNYITICNRKWMVKLVIHYLKYIFALCGRTIVHSYYTTWRQVFCILWIKRYSDLKLLYFGLRYLLFYKRVGKLRESKKFMRKRKDGTTSTKAKSTSLKTEWDRFCYSENPCEFSFHWPLGKKRFSKNPRVRTQETSRVHQLS